MLLKGFNIQALYNEVPLSWNWTAELNGILSIYTLQKK